MTGGTLFSGIGAPEVALPWVDWRWCAETERFPATVHKRRHNIKNLGDVTKADWDNVDPVELVVFGSPCFPAGTLVLCRRGLIPIEEVTTDDDVLTHTGNYRAVLAVGGKVSDTVSLKGQGHFGLECTPEHPFYSRSYKRSGWQRDANGKAHPVRLFSDPSWTPASEMVGNFWAAPSCFQPEPIPKVEYLSAKETRVDIATAEMFYMLGLYVGDGWLRITQRTARPIGETNGLIFICADKKRAGEVAAKLVATGLRWKETDQRTTARFRLCSEPLAHWIYQHFGQYSHAKTIPAWLFGQTEELRRAFIEGYRFADGCNSKGGAEFQFTTVSRRLAIGIRVLLNTLGYSVCVNKAVPKRKVCEIEGRRVSERPTYSLRAWSKPRSSVQICPHRYGYVRKVTYGSRSVPVFNLEVEGDNSYTADGIVVHNCQGFSVAGKRLGLDDPRSNLALIALGIIKKVRARWFIFENVPGLFSNWSGATDEDKAAGQFVESNDFASFLLAVEELGFHISWSVVDSQYSGVAQRRRRVFVVGHTRNWRGPFAVLFDPARLSRNHQTRNETRPRSTGGTSESTGYRRFWKSLVSAFTQGNEGIGKSTVASTLQNGSGSRGWRIDSEAAAGGHQVTTSAFGGGNCSGPIDVSTTLTHHGVRQDFDTEIFVTHAMRAEGFDASEECSVDGCSNKPHAKGMCSPHYKRFVRHGDPLGGRVKEGESMAFLQSGVSYTGEDCLLWPYAKFATGYGSVEREGRTARAHRVMCELAHGPSPSDDLDACHSCGVRLCVNPNHLRWGTRSENMSDAVIHGTTTRGERHANHKLEEREVREIIIRLRSGNETHEAIAADYGVSRNAITDIAKGKNWAWLSSENEDGTGRGTAIVPVAYNIIGGGQKGKNHAYEADVSGCLQHKGLAATGNEAGTLVAIQILEAGARTGKSTTDIRAGIGIGEPNDPMFTLQSGKQHAVAFHARQDPDSAAVTHPLDTDGHSIGIATVPTAFAFEPRFARNGRGAPDSVTAPLKAESGKTGKGDGSPHVITPTMAVRRLTPIEAARLMGFEDTFCHIYRANKKRKITVETAAYYRSHGIKCFEREGQWYTIVAADGPIYRAYGNSMVVPVIKWIGDRIREMDAVLEATT